MNTASLGVTLDERDAVRLWASRSAELVCLVIDAEGTNCEIRMVRVHVESLRDQLPSVLAGLDRWAAEDAGCGKAETAKQQAVDVAARALDLAVAAEKAGAYEVAASLRVAAAEATAKATAVDAHVRAFEGATAEADYAAEKLIYIMSETGAALTCGPEQPDAAAQPPKSP
ncbi:MAG: hypothetical protein GEV28_24590 [Actinophytocola sp.]|uniref:hypothetical protein n=1 Tax=Actinophytocola sp. TaxID=1872138 RepID=UPI0013212315|nr:hypothetical protein [Actinophytocola sp.]MPZ83397.1 hypothetical protein [Actinophytocola sp.]